MDDKKKDIIATILLLTVTASVFFLLGMWSDVLFGFPKRPVTEIEYIPISTSSTVTKSTSGTATTKTAVSDQRTDYSSTVTTSSTAGEDATSAPVQFPINLNAATKEDLMAIKGIGETYAQRILDYRDEINGFDYLEQLMEIEGIGEGRFKAWSPFLTIE